MVSKDDVDQSTGPGCLQAGAFAGKGGQGELLDRDSACLGS